MAHGFGITPACAGKSGIALFQAVSRPESPPRARGRAVMDVPVVIVVGITPARAGKRPTEGYAAYAVKESPPRARGRE